MSLSGPPAYAGVTQPTQDPVARLEEREVTDSLLRAEIAEQPEVLRRLLRDGASDVERVAERLRAHPVRHIVIAARGSSDNAARYAQYVFGAGNRLVVSLATPSLFTRYHAAPQMDGGRTLLGTP